VSGRDVKTFQHYATRMNEGYLLTAFHKEGTEFIDTGDDLGRTGTKSGRKGTSGASSWQEDI